MIVLSVVDARRQGDENPNSSVVTETMKLLASSSYGYQIVYRRRQTVTKYLSGEKHMRLSIVNCPRSLVLWKILCMKLNWPKHRLNTKSQPLSDFYFLRYAKLQKLELYYILLLDYVTQTSSKIWKWTQSLCILLLPRKNWNIVSGLKRKQSGNDCGQKVVATVLLLTDPELPSPWLCCDKHKKHDKRERRLFKKSSDVQLCYASTAWRSAAMMLPPTDLNSVAKVWISVC